MGFYADVQLPVTTELISISTPPLSLSLSPLLSILLNFRPAGVSSGARAVTPVFADIMEDDVLV